jgi:heavy metal sensor kinase
VQGFAKHAGRHLGGWGTVRLRMTLWNVAVLALILGALGSVVRYTVQANLLATVDRILADRARSENREASIEDLRPGQAVRDSRPGPPRALPDRPVAPGGGPLPLGPPARPPAQASESGGTAGRLYRSVRSYAGRRIRTIVQPRGLNPGTVVRVIPRDWASGPPGVHWEEPWDRRSYDLSLTGKVLCTTIHLGGAPVRVLSVPMERQGRVDRVLQLAYPLDGVRRQVDQLTAALLALVPLGLLAAGLGGAFLAGRALRPVREIAETAARLGVNNLSDRLPVTGQDEFSELALSINAMLARLEEAFERQRRFTADASHELRTPLSIVKANTSLALEHPWPEDRYREFLAAINSAAGRQTKIVEELLFLARADAGGLARDMGSVCLGEVLEEAAEAVSRPEGPSVRLESIDPALMVQASGSELTRLFTNLLGNAVRHTPPEGTVTVSAAADATSVTVTVTDTGEGIAPEHLPHLGERFYRVDSARSACTGGTGLGLAICRSITEAHGGQMAIESEVGKGTTVRVQLPLCPPRA